MNFGDKAFFYHSNCKEPGIAGIMEIVKEFSEDSKCSWLSSTCSYSNTGMGRQQLTLPDRECPKTRGTILRSVIDQGKAQMGVSPCQVCEEVRRPDHAEGNSGNGAV